MDLTSSIGISASVTAGISTVVWECISFIRAAKSDKKANENSRQYLSCAGMNYAPPKAGEVLLSIFCPLDRLEEAIGDLQEFYETRWLPRLGPRWARLVYLWHCCSISARFAKDGVLAGIVKAVGKALGKSIAGGI